MVSTDAALATRVGIDILEAGGTAVDAAIAVGFALAVVFPEAGNVGGGGFMVYRSADGVEAALDFRERAPAAATRDMYLDPETKELTDLSVNSALGAGVPGSVAGFWAAHGRYATMPWKALVAPAIKLARDGFAVDRALAKGLVRQQPRIAKHPSTAALFYKNGRPLAQGDRFVNPALADVLQRVADDGPPGFYEGPTADLIVAEMKRSGGIMTKADLAAYTPTWRTPLKFQYRGHTVISMPPPSSGGLVMALMARVLEPLDLKSMGFQSAAHVHRVAEAMRHGFARRNKYLGDPDFVDIPIDKFMSDEAAQEVSAAFDPKRATPSSEVQSAGTGAQGMHTTNYAIMDKAGNAVAVTYTINNSYGCGVVVDGAGFLLNNEMDDFAAAPGQPNAYGLVQGEANAVAANKRPLSSMTPTIVVDAAGTARLVTGAAGGSLIITSTFHVLSRVLDFGLDVQTAVSYPRFHHQHLPDALFVEPGALNADAEATIKQYGHNIIGPPFGGDAPSAARQGDVFVGGIETRQFGASAGGPKVP